MGDSIEFLAKQLLVDKRLPEMSDFSGLPSEKSYDGKDYSTDIIKLRVTEKYVWFYGRTAKPYPYSEEVFDITTRELTPNPRSMNQAEPREQWFAIYVDNLGLYISKHNKKNVIENFLKEFLKKDFLVKTIYKSQEEFFEKLQCIKRVKLIARCNLFSYNSGLFSEAENLLGLGNPSQVQIDICAKLQENGLKSL